MRCCSGIRRKNSPHRIRHRCAAPVTFLAHPRKVTKRMMPKFAAILIGESSPIHMVSLRFSPRPAAAELTHRRLSLNRHLRVQVIVTSTSPLVRQSSPKPRPRLRCSAALMGVTADASCDDTMSVVDTKANRSNPRARESPIRFCRSCSTAREAGRPHHIFVAAPGFQGRYTSRLVVGDLFRRSAVTVLTAHGKFLAHWGE